MTTSATPPAASVTARAVGVVGTNTGTINLTPSLAPADYVRSFRALIDQLADTVVGRDDLLDQIDAFGAGGPLGRGFLLVEGDAGLGKTSLAAAVSRRRAALPFFFGAGGGEPRWDECLRHLCGLIITRYNLSRYSMLPPGAGTNWNVLTDLLEQAVSSSQSAVWIVLDAIDQAAGGPVLPDRLPLGTYVMITRRPAETPLAIAPDVPSWSYRLQHDDAAQKGAIEKLLQRETRAGSKVASALAAAQPAVDVDIFVARAAAASDGNFMYVRYLLHDIAEHAAGTPIEVDAFPAGLGGYYATFWTQIEQVKGTDRPNWAPLYRPVIERLAVAFAPVTAAWLADQVGADVDDVRDLALARWERFLAWSGAGPQQTWRIVHRSFADFLATKLSLPRAHRAVAEHAFVRYADRWWEWDMYSLRYVATHLGRAAEGLPEPDRHAVVQELVGTVESAGFRAEHSQRLDDPAALQDDLELALAACADDPTPNVGPTVVSTALTLANFRASQLRSETVFELARGGAVKRAEQQLALVAAAADLDQDWHEALRLCLAWLAAGSAPADARELNERIIRGHGINSPLHGFLAQRMAGALDNAPPPPGIGDFGAPPTTLSQAEGLVARLRGEGVDQSMLGSGTQPHGPLGEMLGPGGRYLSQADGPRLVAFAWSDGDDKPLADYVEVHKSYGYRTYRNGSLWALLASVLLHPDAEWTRNWIARLGITALNRGVEFREGTRIALTASRAMGGDAAARSALDAQRDAALALVDSLPGQPAEEAPDDPWSLIRRRLGALAEAYSYLPDGMPYAERLLELAADVAPEAAGSAAPRDPSLPRGFAGFRAPAYLTLAETARILHRATAATIPFEPWQLVKELLESALGAAHNIQDPVFCARMTARVNAMEQRWWPLNGSVSETIQRLRLAPASAEFTSLHRVGEDYIRRDPQGSQLPASLLDARSYASLARAYERPLTDVLRANTASPDTDTTSTVPSALVNMPDPGFIPLLAARLAAEALATPAVSGTARVGAIQALVPVATANLTALDTVLARLLLAASPDEAALDKLIPLLDEQDATDVPNLNVPLLPG